MLLSIKIKNLALVEDVELHFDRGMSVLTGETGAGKSVIVTALSMALGERADKDSIRHGANEANIEARFSADSMSPQYKKDFAEYLKEGQFVVSREIARDGTSKVRLNNVTIPLNRLRELTYPLAEILGQHANQVLLNETNHLGFLDSFSQVEHLREEVAAVYHEWSRTESEYASVQRSRQQLMDERELLLFQKDEIEKAKVRPGEETELLAQRKLLDSARSLMVSADRIQNVLDGEMQSVIAQLRFARKEAERMAEIDPYLEKSASQLAEADFLIEDIRRSFEQYGAGIQDDPSKLEEINNRLDEIYRLKKKYGGSEQSILDAHAHISERLAQRPDTDKLIDYLEKETTRLKKVYAEKATTLSEVRKKGADYFRKLVVKELSGLAMEHAAFEVDFVYEPDKAGIPMGDATVKAQPHGLESCRFLFSANAGEPLKSLVKTASGGEMSRVLLAIKAAEKKNAKLTHSLLVFDEVDAGIGGTTATEVGKKLARLAENGQVLVITHLHQIARLADHHFVAEKNRSKAARAVIQVKKLDHDGIKAELERMIALPDGD